MARIGAGAMDIVSPLIQAYYDAQRPWAPEKAANYTRQRAADEAAYLAGYAPEAPANLRDAKPDFWRAFGTSAAWAPLGGAAVARALPYLIGYQSTKPYMAEYLDPLEQQTRQRVMQGAWVPPPTK
jgi:hypothetical protein